MARSLIVWGCSSGAGKSWLTTALCRAAARRGIDVVPFKAQNMSNNARVVPGLDGAPAEIGSAQYLQALAAGVVPGVDMNPVLLKPESDTASQVLLHGRADAALSRLPWRARSAHCAQAAQHSFQRLAARHALVVVEGAGSPAEINLAPEDYVNLGTARWARAAGPTRALLVADIDRGGAFAHAVGTAQLLPDDLRPLLQGFVFNRFRGDPALLAPGPAQLQALTGVPLRAVIPWLDGHGLPEEDGWGLGGGAAWLNGAGTGGAGRAGAADEAGGAGHAGGAGGAGGAEGAGGAGGAEGAPGAGRGPAPPVSAAPQPRTVAVIAWPRISNLDEFAPLAQVPGLRLCWVREPAQLAGLTPADWVLLPGSKQVSGDLAWLRARGLAAAVQAHAAAGGAVLGICGGLQALGQRLDDPQGHDGLPGHSQGLGLLPLATRYAARKTLREGALRFGAADGPWAALSGLACRGYEIHAGESALLAAPARPVLFDGQGRVLGWQRGTVLGVYAHGLFEQPAVMAALFGRAAPRLDEAFDRLADAVEAAFGRAQLDALLG